jgi:hypothetical protein
MMPHRAEAWPELTAILDRPPRRKCTAVTAYRPAHQQLKIGVRHRRRFMPAVDNKAVARRVLQDLVTQGRFEVVDEIYAPSFELRDPTAGQKMTTHEGIKNLVRDIRTGTPDISVAIEEEIAEGDGWSIVGPRADTVR